jgi:hypothetical protein
MNPTDILPRVLLTPRGNRLYHEFVWRAAIEIDPEEQPIPDERGELRDGELVIVVDTTPPIEFAMPRDCWAWRDRN